MEIERIWTPSEVRMSLVPPTPMIHHWLSQIGGNHFNVSLTLDVSGRWRPLSVPCSILTVPIRPVTIFATAKSFDANITISGNLNVLNGKTRLAIM